MRNGAYSLAFLTAIGGLVLLMIAPQGADLKTSLGVLLIGVAVLLVVIGKVIDLLGHVRDGMTDS